MGEMVQQVEKFAHRVFAEKSKRMAKVATADVRKAEIEMEAWRRQVGAALDRARHNLGWNLDQLAQALGKDARQVRRWINGSERPHLDVIYAVPELRGPISIALAQIALAHGSGITIETVIRVPA